VNEASRPTTCSNKGPTSELDFPHFSSAWASGHNPEDILVGDEA
jgi:hypothetical protein